MSYLFTATYPTEDFPGLPETELVDKPVMAGGVQVGRISSVVRAEHNVAMTIQLEERYGPLALPSTHMNPPPKDPGKFTS